MILTIKKLYLFLLFFGILLLHILLINAFANNDSFPIIMYHNITPVQKFLGKYGITPQEFENDIIFIKKAGYTTITITQLINHVKTNAPLPNKPIILTFDDGQESFLHYVLPILEKYDMKAVISVVGFYADFATEHEEHNPDYSYLDWNELNALSKNAHVEIQNHTYNFHRITNSRVGCKKSKNESEETYKKNLYEDVNKLQKKIKEVTNVTPNTFVYPFGAISHESYDTLKECGFEAFLTCSEKEISLSNINLFNLGRFNRPHGISSENFFNKF